MPCTHCTHQVVQHSTPPTAPDTTTYSMRIVHGRFTTPDEQSSGTSRVREHSCRAEPGKQCNHAEGERYCPTIQQQLCSRDRMIHLLIPGAGSTIISGGEPSGCSKENSPPSKSTVFSLRDYRTKAAARKRGEHIEDCVRDGKHRLEHSLNEEGEHALCHE